MQYDNHEEESQDEILTNLAFISQNNSSFPGKSVDKIVEEDDAWMVADAANARIDIEVECWGRRLA